MIGDGKATAKEKVKPTSRRGSYNMPGMGLIGAC